MRLSLTFSDACYTALDSSTLDVEGRADLVKAFKAAACCDEAKERAVVLVDMHIRVYDSLAGACQRWKGRGK